MVSLLNPKGVVSATPSLSPVKENTVVLQRIGHVKRGVGSADDGLGHGVLQEDLIEGGVVGQEEEAGEEVVVLRNNLQVEVGQPAGVLTELPAQCRRSEILKEVL